MEAGYDYMLLRNPERRRAITLAGIFFAFIGLMLLAVGGAYFVYAANARANLGELEATLPGAASETALAVESAPADPPKQAAMITGGPAEPRATAAPPAASPDDSMTKETGVVHVAGNDMALPESVIGGQMLFPGESLLPKFWSDPLSYESAPELHTLLESFTPVEAGQGFPRGSRAASTRLIAPSVDIDSRVVELGIEDRDGILAYETPDRAAGHIPEMANAGESGAAWFFGHTETPLLGEGEIFFNLTRAPGMLKEGRDLFVIMESSEGRYLYRLTSSEVMSQDELQLYDTEGATIHLVSCVPRLTYDHRLVVSGELVGYNAAS